MFSKSPKLASCLLLSSRGRRLGRDVRIGVVPPVGPWRSWERASMASRRSWVRIPSAPPTFKSDSKNFAYRTRACAKVIIENGERPLAVFMPPSRCAVVSRSASRWQKRTKKKPAKLQVLDPDSPEDLDEVIIHHNPGHPP